MLKRKIYTKNSFGGLDLNDTSDSSNSGYVKNMIKQNGGCVKRNGWKTLCTFRDENYQPLKINGIYEFTSKGGEAYILVHAGTHMYRCSRDFKEVKEIFVEDKRPLLDRKSVGYMCEENLWIVGASEMLIYDGNELVPAYESRYVYVPTTLSCTGSVIQYNEGAKRKSPNLLTNMRKNSFILRAEDARFFRLDAKAKMGSDISIITKLRVKRSGDSDNDVTTIYIGTNKDGEEINEIITARFKSDSLEDNTLLYPCEPLIGEAGEEVFIKRDENICDYTGVGWMVNISSGRTVTMVFSPKSPDLTTDNIIVSFTSDAKSENVFEKAILAQAVTSRLGTNILLVSNGDNKLYYSDAREGFSYFPSDNVICVGDTREPITAIVPMADNYIGVYKKNGFYRIKINPDKTGEYEIYASADVQGCIGPYTSASLCDDAICLNKNGVFGISRVGKTTVTVKCLKNRSYPIDRELKLYTDKELEDAVACVHNGKYYLFIKDKVYVADNLYKSKHTQGTDSFYYEWWMLDNCDCVQAKSIGDFLYMGRKNGAIAIFDDGYTDRDSLIVTKKGQDMLISNRDNHSFLTMADGIGAKSGDKISLGEHYVLLTQAIYQKKTGLLHISYSDFFDENGNVAVYDGLKIRIYDTKNVKKYEGKIVTTHVEQAAIEIPSLYLNDGEEYSIYLKGDDEDYYTLEKYDDGFFLMRNERPIRLLSNDIDSVRIEREQEIIGEICSSPICMGKPYKNKSLHGISVSLVAGTGGVVDIGYQTSKNSASRSVKVADCGVFENIDFNNFAFEPPIKKSVRMSFIERSFDYIVVKITLRGKGYMGVDKMSLEYSEVNN